MRASPLLTGAMAGIVGTFAMTVAKQQLFGQLRPENRYPLPPREIVQDVGERLAGHALPAEETTTATLAAHFGFGAACGVAFSALGLHRRAPVPAGVLYGLGIWTGSYLGWLPALGILTPATRHPPRRNWLMAAVHVVWGGVTGYAAAKLAETRYLYSGTRAQPDRADGLSAARKLF